MAVAAFVTGYSCGAAPDSHRLPEAEDIRLPPTQVVSYTIAPHPLAVKANFIGAASWRQPGPVLPECIHPYSLCAFLLD